MAHYFISDIHGEAGSFHAMLTSDVLKNGFLCVVSYARECSRPKMLANIIDSLENQELFLLNPRAIIKKYR